MSESDYELTENSEETVDSESYFDEYENFLEEYLLYKDTELFKCVAEIDISRSSIFLDPLYHFPEIEDPHLEEALWEPEEPTIYDDAGCVKYIKLCEEEKLIPFRRVLKSLPGDQLNLKYYGLKTKVLGTIFEALQYNNCVTHLTLEENKLSPEALTCINDMLDNNNTLISLNLSRCSIDRTGIEKLQQGIWHTKSLKVLDLSYNNIEDDGIEAITSGLQYNMSIRKLNLSHNNLAERAMIAFYTILEDNYYMLDLDLSWNYFYSVKGMQSLMEGLKENIGLLSLNLAWNGIGDKDAFIYILSYLKTEGTHLQHLNLSNNRITGISVRMLKTGLKLNESLIDVDLSFNPLTVDEVEFLATTLLETKETSNLQSIDFGNKWIKKSFIKTLNKIKKKGCVMIFDGIYSNYKIQGPNVKEMLLNRAKYLAMKPKKKKLKKDIGHFMLKLPEEPISSEDFTAMFKQQKIKLDEDLVNMITKTWSDAARQVNVKDMKEFYLKLYPDTQLPPPKKKKKKKKKK